ncbi:MAG TPA: DUF1315 family protein [Spongiibacteraceae bacterium]|nr:DUF1315 family protein [Spongiibacteraceae bacterium]
MDFNQLIDDITPDIYRNLKRAVEIGKWPDGRVLTAEQRALSMQAVIAFEARHLDERERTGFIDRGAKQEGELCDDEAPSASSSDPASAEQALKWQQ